MQAIIATITFLFLDALWLGFVGKQFYLDEIGHMMRMSDGTAQPLWPAAIVVYLALIGGILVFVLPKANGNLLSALLYGGLFGLVTYATYDFTNLATLNNWSIKISFIDTVWGMVLCGTTACLTAWLSRLL